MHHATIHLIDDDDSFLRAAARLLRASGYRVKVYGCASDFLDEPREEQRGCVISDLQMPGLNGLDLQEAMHGKGITMPLIFRACPIGWCFFWNRESKNFGITHR